MPNENWERLGRFVKERREKMGLTQLDVQKAGGPSAAKQREIENGRTDVLSLSKRRDLERALGWTAGSIDAALKGGDPDPADHPRQVALREIFDEKGPHRDGFLDFLVKYQGFDKHDPEARIRGTLDALRDLLTVAQEVAINSSADERRVEVIQALMAPAGLIRLIELDLDKLLEENFNAEPATPTTNPPATTSGASGATHEEVDAGDRQQQNNVHDLKRGNQGDGLADPQPPFGSDRLAASMGEKGYPDDDDEDHDDAE